jgi:cytochrome c-type biogenesis protein
VTAAGTPDLTSWWGPSLAFLAGLASFASPCVFPLVPGYLAFVTGGPALDRGLAKEQRRPIVPIGLFILGFTLVFVLVGSASAAWAPLLRGRIGQGIAGGLVAIMGLLMLAFTFQRGAAWIFAEWRPLLSRVHPRAVGALPLGMAFAAGWTPCIGPVLGAILSLAATGGAAQGAFLLFVYSLGLGAPFFLLGLGIHSFTPALAWVRHKYRWISGASGMVLVVVGVLIGTGIWTRLVAPLARYASGL